MFEPVRHGNERSHGQLAAELGHAFTLVLQRDFCSEQFIAKAAVFGTFTLNGTSLH